MKKIKLTATLFTLFAFIALLFFIIIFANPIIGLANYWGQTIPTLKEDPKSTVLRQELPYNIINDINTFGLTYKAEYDIWTVKERVQKGFPTKMPEITPYLGAKVVYLTFDDGPDIENTPLILDILNEHEVLGTFFVIGSEAKKNPDLIQRIFREGHALGNHTFNHVYKELYRSPESYVQQLHQTDEVIKSIIGVRPHISRAPGGSTGSFNKNFWEKIKTEGYIEVGWNISSGDASQAKSEQIAANVISQLNKTYLQNRAIVLMHDGRGHAETVKALPTIIKFLKEQGFEFRVINSQTPSPW